MNEKAFVNHLVAIQNDRGSLAILRNWLIRDNHWQCASIVEPFNDNKEPNWSAWCKYLVGSLFAFHPSHSEKVGDFGKTFQKLSYSNGEFNNSMQMRFYRLVEISGSTEEVKNELKYHLLNAVRMVKSKNISINYYELLCDLVYWRRTKEKWCRHFARIQK